MKRFLIASIVVSFNLPVFSTRTQQSNPDPAKPNSASAFNANNALLAIEATIVQKHPNGHYFASEASAGGSGGGGGGVITEGNAIAGGGFGGGRMAGGNTTAGGGFGGGGTAGGNATAGGGFGGGGRADGNATAGGGFGGGGRAGGNATTFSTGSTAANNNQYNMQARNNTPPTQAELNKDEVKRLEQRLQMALNELGYIREKAEEEKALKTIEAIDTLQKLKQTVVKAQTKKILKQKSPKVNPNPNQNSSPQIIQFTDTAPVNNQRMHQMAKQQMDTQRAAYLQREVNKLRYRISVNEKQRDATLAEIQTLLNLAKEEEAQDTMELINTFIDLKSKSMLFRIESLENVISFLQKDLPQPADRQNQIIEVMYNDQNKSDSSSAGGF